MKQIFGIIIAVFLFGSFSYAQQIPANINPATINIDQISDQQLMQFLGMANGSNMSEEEMVAKAKEKGLSDEQIQKLRIRIQSLNGGASKSSSDTSSDYRRGVASRSPNNSVLMINGLPVFGSSLFAKENQTGTENG